VASPEYLRGPTSPCVCRNRTRKSLISWCAARLDAVRQALAGCRGLRC
jgi:hypothetical protein